MGVKFLTLAQGAGSNGSFSDTFNRANAGEGAGPNWAINRTQSTVNIDVFNLLNNKLRWQNNAGVGTGVSMMYALPGWAIIPTPGAATTAAVQAGSHFSQITIAADNSILGSLTRLGPAVSMNGLQNVVGSGCYMIENLPELLSFNLTRYNAPSTFTNLVDHSATPQYSTVVGLDLKISVEYLTAGPRLRTYCNGVLIDTFQDTNASRHTNGGPGIMGEFCSAGRTCDISFYRCGAGI